MATNRRRVLKLGGVGALAAVAGCIGVQEQNQTTQGDGGDGGDGSSGDGSGGDGGGGGDGGDTEEETTAEGPTGTATAWYSLPESEVQMRKAVISSFNEESRHTVEGADISDLEKKTTSAIPAGQGPQLFEWAHDWVGDYYQRGFVVDRSDAVDVSLDSFIGPARQAIQFEGNLVGLPVDAETVTLVYNADVVDEPPETVDDMVAAMEEYHAPSKNQYGLSLPFDPYFLSGWLQAFGGYYFDPKKDPQLGVDSDACVRGLQFALDNLAPYMPNDPSYEPQAAAFAEGNAAFAINGPWYLATLNEKGVNYEVTTFPSVDGGSVTPYTGITMWYFAKGMESNEADAAAALDFAEWYVTNEDHVTKRATEQGAIPVLKSLVGSEDLPAAVQAFSQTVDQGTPMPTHPKMNKVWSPVADALVNAFNGDATPEDALTTAAETIRSNWD